MKQQEREEARTSPEISVQSSRFLRWLDNFWYHYKWQTIGIAFALVVLLVCVLQTCSKEKIDLTVVYAGPVALSGEELAGVEQVLETILPEDIDGDGEKNLSLARYTIYSKEQIVEMEKQGYSINRQLNSSEYDNYGNYVLTGESSIYLVDPWLYESLKSGERIHGEGIRLGDTAAYQKYDLLAVLPEDTVVCLLRQQVMGKNHDDEHYAKESVMFAVLSEGAQ